MNLNNYQRQHKDIEEVIEKIYEIINQNEIEECSSELAININKLAGKLQIHLNSEDKFLYPNLLKDEKTKDISQKYIDEMGGMLVKFTSYKEKFNTTNKIKTNKNYVVVETKAILGSIEERMKREENELYKLI
ncbi:hemerythrin domain-containing protein [Clostridium sp.]|uniref:hemerythrin domain-containing protein n=1 Tax=Clostridium sp. TaxID=1506 RepID=UPI003217CAFF